MLASELWRKCAMHQCRGADASVRGYQSGQPWSRHRVSPARMTETLAPLYAALLRG
jgi:hypothetical protein